MSSVEQIFGYEPTPVPTLVEPVPVADARFDKMPQFLKDKKIWVCRKADKTPWDAKTGKGAKANDPETWSSFEDAVAAFDNPKNNYAGIGFELEGTDYVGVDFDNCFHNGVIDPYPLDIMKRLDIAYSEVSPSETGVHVLVPSTDEVLAALKKGKRFNAAEHDGVEIYATARYFTCTNNQISIPKGETNFRLAYWLMSQFKEKSFAKFKKLWTGDMSDYADNHSNADMALLDLLAIILHKDPVKVEQMFGMSALGQRDKWTEREDYRRMSIAKACGGNEPTSHAESDRWEPEPHSKPTTKDVQFHLPPAIGGTHRDYVFEPAPGMYDGFFPRGTVSVIAGTSGAGKTTWMIQALLAQRTKTPWLGHPASVGYSFVMLGADRDEDDHKRTMESMHLPLDAFPFEHVPLSAFDGDAVQTIIDLFEAQTPRPEIVFIEGLDLLVTNGNDPHVVSLVLDGLQKFAKHYHIAVIGSVGSPKSKEGHGYSISRENILGSGVWSRCIHTVVTMQFPNGDDSTGRRLVVVESRRAKKEKVTMEFQEGQLVVVPDDPEEQDTGSALSRQTADEIEWYQVMAQKGKTDTEKRWWTV